MPQFLEGLQITHQHRSAGGEFVSKVLSAFIYQDETLKQG